jgi:signal transduction histidine kinase
MFGFHCLLLQSSAETSGIISRFIEATGFLIAALAFACLIFFMIARQRQNKLYLQQKAMEELEKQLLQSQIEVQEATLTALGKELHDNIGQLLSSSKMLLGVTLRNMDKAPGPLATAYDTLSKAITELRALSRSLDSEWLQQFNLIDNLTTEVARNNAASALQIHFTHPESIPLKAGQQILLFRMVQEAIQNAVKHAEASNIYIAIDEGGTNLNITVSDDGKGFIVENALAKGAGMNNIRHRTRALGGNVHWHSGSTGTILSIHLPVQKEIV